MPCSRHEVWPVVLFLMVVIGWGRPAVGDDFRVETIAPSAVRLHWNAIRNAPEGYRIERKTNDGDGWELLAKVASDRSSYESVGLRADRPVLHRIRPIGTDADWRRFEAINTPDHPDRIRGRLLLEETETFPRQSEGDLIRLNSGELLYMFGRWPTTGDAARNVRIGSIRSPDGGKTWSDPETVFKSEGHDLYHASLTRLENGDIGLSYTKRNQGKHHHQTGNKVFRYSTDEGRTWFDEIVISDGGDTYYQTSRNDVLTRTSDGRLVHPVSRLLTPGKGAEGGIGTLVYTSDDQGRTWTRRTPDPLREPNEDVFHEATTIEYAPGKLLMLARTHTGWLYASRSSDGGESWTDPRKTWIPSAISPPQLFSVPGRDTIMLVWNPYVGEGRRLGPRLILAAWFSQDGGRTWFGYQELEHHPVAVPDRNHAGYCYASGAWIDETLHLTYMDMHGSKKGAVQTRYLQILLEDLPRSPRSK